jgi:hypothetical protein
MNKDSYFYYTAHQEDIIKNHLDDFVVIQGNKVRGYYKTCLEGLSAMADRKAKLGTFIVHKCRPVGESDMAVTDLDFKVVPAWTR